MDFAVSQTVKQLQARLLEFMNEYIYPNEQRFYREVERNRWLPTRIIEELKPKARAAGLWNLFLPDEERGAGLTNLEYAPLCEIMGREVRWSNIEKVSDEMGLSVTVVGGTAPSRLSIARARERSHTDTAPLNRVLKPRALMLRLQILAISNAFTCYSYSGYKTVTISR